MTDLKRNLICLRFRSDFFMCNTDLQSTYRQILGWNKPIRRQAPLPGGKPACSRFPRLVLFYLWALSTERLKISINQFQIFIFLLWGEKAYIDKVWILRYNSFKSYKIFHEDINFFGETPSWARNSLQK